MRKLPLLLLALAVTAACADPLADQMQAQLHAGEYKAAAQSAQALLFASQFAGDKANTALAHYGLGETAFVADDYKGAIEHYAKAAALSVELKRTEDAAYCYYMEGLCERITDQWPKCSASLTLALKLYGDGGDRTMRGKAHVILGEALYNQSLLKEARETTEAGLELLRNTEASVDYIGGIYQLGLIISGTGDEEGAEKQYQHGLELARAAKLPKQIAIGLNNLSSVDEAAGRYADCEAKLREAVETYKQSGDDGMIESFYGNLARVIAAQGKNQDGIRLYQVAISLAEKGGRQASLATLLTALATVYTELGQTDEALKLLERAAEIRTKLGDTLGLSVTLCNKAMALSARGELREALSIYLKVMETYEKLGAKELLSTVLNNVGRIYDIQGDVESAMRYFERSLDLALEIKRPLNAALAYNNMGLALYNVLKPSLPVEKADTSDQAKEIRDLMAKARAAFEKAVEVFKESGVLTYAATALNNLGQAAADVGELDEAEKYLNEALDLHRRTGSQPGQYQTLNNLGLLALRHGKLDLADKQLHEALKLCERCGDIEVQSGTWLNLAMLSKTREDLPAAIDAAIHSLSLIEQRRDLIGGGEHEQRQFLAANVNAYKFLIELLMQAKRPEDAFIVAERARARSMLEMLVGGKLDLHRRLPAEEVAPLRAREAELSAAQGELSRLANAVGTPEAALTKAREAVTAAREAVDTEEQRLHARHPDEEQASGVEPLNLQRVGRLLPPDTALLEFASSTTSNWLFVVTLDDDRQPVLHSYTLDFPPGGLADAVSRYRAACANPRRKYKELGGELYTKLLGKAAAEMPKEITRLVIVPDESLFDCPFHALWDDAKQQFVAERFEVVYTGSASLLGACLDLGNERRAQPATGGMLLVADPDFGSEPAAALDPAAARDSRAFRLTRLPGTRLEADMISKLMPQVTERVGVDAQERTIKKELPKYRWLHFATHGLLEPEQPLYSSIALAKPDRPGEDGFLEARELANLTLHAELVTLSACQTGRGQAQLGEGLIGLPWAFTVARVPTQVVSLWSVDDAVTKELMQRFYKLLAAGTPKAKALREAEMDLRKSQLTLPGGDTVNPDHPFYWAPFVLLGDWH